MRARKTAYFYIINLNYYVKNLDFWFYHAKEKFHVIMRLF